MRLGYGQSFDALRPERLRPGVGAFRHLLLLSAWIDAGSNGGVAAFQSALRHGSIE